MTFSVRPTVDILHSEPAKLPTIFAPRPPALCRLAALAGGRGAYEEKNVNDKTTIIDAAWDATNECYRAGDWTSLDGDSWLDENGYAADTDDFQSATIRLVGGPRDGTEVS